VEVSLSEVQEVNIMLVNAGGNAVVFDYTKDGSDRYDWEVRVPELTQGSYFLVLKVGKETKAIRVVKI
jgi:hypothetical protein